MAVDTKNHYTGHFVGGSMFEYGIASFVTTGTTIEIPCGFSVIETIQISPNVTHANTDILFCDGVVDGGTTTISRDSGDTVGLTFSYLILGLY